MGAGFFLRQWLTPHLKNQSMVHASKRWRWLLEPRPYFSYYNLAATVSLAYSAVLQYNPIVVYFDSLCSSLTLSQEDSTLEAKMSSNCAESSQQETSYAETSRSQIPCTGGRH
jgi:hypothetical protein